MFSTLDNNVKKEALVVAVGRVTCACERAWGEESVRSRSRPPGVALPQIYRRASDSGVRRTQTWGRRYR